MLKLGIATAALLLAAGGSANAACKMKDARGVWLFTIAGQICQVDIAGSGKFSEGMCRDLKGKGTPIDGRRVEIDGRISVKPDCSATGQMTGVEGPKRTTQLVDGRLNVREETTTIPFSADGQSATFYRQF